MIDDNNVAVLRSRWQTYLTSEIPASAGSRGVCYLPELALLRFSGRDTQSFLQGYLTSDTFKLGGPQLVPTSLCNLKGRVVANGWCGQIDDVVDLIVHRSMTKPLVHFLKNYLAFSKTMLQNCADSHLIFGSIESNEPYGRPIGEGQCLYVVEDFQNAHELRKNTKTLSQEQWACRLILDEYALVSLPVSERFLPQMLQLDRKGAVDFDKGCYLGQEVIARAQHLGRIKRQLARLSWNGREPAAATEFQTSDGSMSGVVIQAGSTEPDSGTCLAVVANVNKKTDDGERETSFQIVR